MIKIKRRIKVYEKFILGIKRIAFILRKGDEVVFRKIKGKVYVIVNNEKQYEISEEKKNKILEINL